MQDYYRNAITQLLLSDYDVFVPTQQHRELVVSNGEWLKRCVVRPTYMSDDFGPYLRVSKAEDSPMLDAVIASCPAHQLAWLIPIDAARQSHIVRLGKHEAWLVSLIDRPDAGREMTKALREQQRSEAKMTKNAASEQQFYRHALSQDSEGAHDADGN